MGLGADAGLGAGAAIGVDAGDAGLGPELWRFGVNTIANSRPILNVCSAFLIEPSLSSPMRRRGGAPGGEPCRVGDNRRADSY